MAEISMGIKLFHGEKELTNLQEIPELGTAEIDSIEITTLADAAHRYTDGLKNYGDSLEFKFLYEKEQFTELNALEGEQTWKVQLPDNATCSFSGSCSVRLEGVGVGAALTYVLAVRPSGAMVWA